MKWKLVLMLEKYKMNYLKNFPIILVGYAFMILFTSIIAVQLKLYTLLYSLSIIAPIGTFILISTFLIKFYKAGKRKVDKSSNS